MEKVFSASVIEGSEKQELLKNITTRLEAAITEMKKGSQHPSNPAWWSSMAEAHALIEKGDPIGSIGNEEIYQTGPHPRLEGEQVFSADKTIVVYKLVDCRAVNQNGVSNKLYASIPEGWIESEDGQTAYPSAK